jgi:uncharacterized protein (TIGR02466 family)
MKVIDLFPKTIGVDVVDSLTDEMIEYSKKYSMLTDGESGSLSQNQNVLDDEVFAAVKTEILAKADEFAKTVFGHIYDDLAISNSWLNIVEKDQQINLHKHTNSYLSGVFYLTDGSPFTFYNVGNEAFHFQPESLNPNNPRVANSFNVNPSRGVVLLFPSTMYHMVQRSDEDKERISLAFNIIPKGTIGSETNQIKL